MFKDANASIARFIPKPIRRNTRTWILPPVLRTLRRLTGERTHNNPTRRYGVGSREAFVGYYDVQPISPDGGALLAHVTDVRRRAVRAGDEAGLGYFDVSSGEFTPVATTVLWCWQMGARLRWWHGHGDRVLAFNALSGGQPSFCVAEEGRVSRALCDLPLFDVAPNQEIGIALNFARLARCRPGYGYLALKDRFADQNLPEGDGVTFVDIASGKAELAYPLPRFAKLSGGGSSDQYHYLNAASLSPSGKRFSVLYKRIRDLARPDLWDVEAFVGDTGQDRLRRVALPGRASHYWWMDDDRIAYTSVSGSRCEYMVYDATDDSARRLHPAAPEVDGHPSLNSRTGEWLTDQYPDFYGEQALYVFEENSQAPRQIARFAADPRYVGEYRCDLHPRFAPQGDLAIVDSTHEGYRAVYAVELTDSR